MNRRVALATTGFVAVVAAGVAVWAEFADLGQVQLIAVGAPVLALATGALVRASAGPALARLGIGLAGGALLGLLLLGGSEGLYLALHFARGGELDVEGYESQAAMAGVLLGVHAGVGLAGGALVGAATGAVALAWPGRGGAN